VAEIQDVRAPRLGGADVGELDRRLVPARVCSRTVGPADRRLSQVALERDVLGEDAPALVVLAELIDEIAAGDRRNAIKSRAACAFGELAATAAYLNEQPHLFDKWSGLNPLGRLGRPDELRGVVAWLASDASTFCTGSE